MNELAAIARIEQPKRKGGRPPRGQEKYPGLTADARSLNISKTHLYFVLSGRRESVPLLARWHALKKSQATEAPSAANPVSEGPSEPQPPPERS